MSLHLLLRNEQFTEYCADLNLFRPQQKIILAFAEKCAKRYPKYFPHFNLGIYEKSKFKIIFMKCTAKKSRSSTASKALREVADILFDLRQKKHLAAEGVFVKEHPPFGGIDSSKRKNNQT